jgi:hypothetical protein
MSNSPIVSVADGQVLTVTADAGSYGTVWQEGTTHQWTVGAKSPLHLGAGLYRIETVRGNVTHSVDSQAVASLNAVLPTITEDVWSQRIVTAAIIDGLQARRSSGVSAFADKFKLLVERVKEVPSALEARIDPLFPRLDAAEAKGGAAAVGLEAHVAGVEAGVAAIEDVVNQISNGAPVDPN